MRGAIGFPSWSLVADTIAKQDQLWWSAWLCMWQGICACMQYAYSDYNAGWRETPFPGYCWTPGQI